MEREIRAQTDVDEGEVVVAQWYYKDGAVVAAGATVCSIMVEKAAYDVTAPVSGRLMILAAQDAVVRAGEVVGRILPE